MTLWLNRAGSRGERESKCLDDNRIYMGWDGLKFDLSTVASKHALSDLLRKVYPNAPKGRISQNTGQIWPFAHEMKSGDWVVLPSKMKAAIHIAEVTGPYVFDPNAEASYYHYHTVKWIKTDIPRSNFAPDVLMAFGTQCTICKIHRHDAEDRVRAMAKVGWKSADSGKPQKQETEHDEGGEQEQDLELLAGPHRQADNRSLQGAQDESCGSLTGPFVFERLGRHSLAGHPASLP